MKTRILIIILIGLSVVGIFGGPYVTNWIKNMEDQKTCEEIRGTWDTDHCLISSEIFESNKLTCDPGPVMSNGICSSHGLTLMIQSKISKDADNFDKTWGGPGNRHPAFRGFDISEVCTEDMIKHLVKYSSMFDRNAPYSLEWIGIDESIDRDGFDRCVEGLLERNPKEIENEE